MTDEILRTRLTEVRSTLERASLTRLRPLEADGFVDPEANWITVGLSLPTLEGQVIHVVKESWAFLESQFKQESERIAGKITALEERLEQLDEVANPDERQTELVRLWEEYATLESRSESLLGEIVELLGGLALRDRSVDPWFFATADQLVRWYAQRTSDSWDALTVPFVRAVARTLVQIVGLRFPEWSVWALPLTAYEFAYQYLRYGPRAAKVREMVEEDLGEVEVAKIKEMADFRALLADSFATFTTGPAYLFAALGLRLSRQEAERAQVIFRVLASLDDKGKTFNKEFLDTFRVKWESSPASGGALGADRTAQLERFADAALRALRMSYLTRYSVSDYEQAREINKVWMDAKEGVPLKMPATTARLKLIDVLNAAWLSRFERGADTDRLEKAARKLCDQIIKSQRSTGTGTPQQQSATPARTGAGE